MDKKIEMLDGNGIPMYPLTTSKNVTMANGDTIDKHLTNATSGMFSPSVYLSNSYMSKIGVGDSVDISSNVIDSPYSDVVIGGNTLVNLLEKQNYSVSIAPENSEKYSIWRSGSHVKITVTDMLSSWYYISAGALIQNRFKPNTKYFVYFPISKGITSVQFYSGNAVIKMSKSSVKINHNMYVVTTTDTIPEQTDNRVVVTVNFNGSIGKAELKDAMV